MEQHMIQTYPMLALFLVMLVAGLLGGAINHFLAQENNDKPCFINFMGRDLLVGLGASFAVPLFLNMISSDLVKVIVHGGNESNFEPEKIYVFAGFCLIASISSRAFIRTLSDKILKEATEANQNAQAADKKFQQMQDTVAPIIERETENDTDAIGFQEEFPVIDENAGKVLSALAYGTHTLRSLSGLAKEAGISKEEVHRLLDDLMAKELVAQRERERGPRWYITVEGRRITRNIQQLGQPDGGEQRCASRG